MSQLFCFRASSIANFVLSWFFQPIPRGLVTAARLLNMAAVHCFVHGLFTRRKGYPCARVKVSSSLKANFTGSFNDVFLHA